MTYSALLYQASRILKRDPTEEEDSSIRNLSQATKGWSKTKVDFSDVKQVSMDVENPYKRQGSIRERHSRQ